MIVSLIAAIARNGVIGCYGKLPWDIPEDMAYFRRVTSGGVLIMGRKTFESVGVLPNRFTIVLSNVLMGEDEDFVYISSVSDAIQYASRLGASEVFVCGGSKIYSEFLDVVDRMYITHLNDDYEGDSFFPVVDYSKFEVISSVDFSSGKFCVYERI
ncbi:dihydrofolate reductase [Candidatus Woesearchaeota archaeon]|nr:dihydrofolate reductase [Candidatus Woesearchaeota archaeon]